MSEEFNPPIRAITLLGFDAVEEEEITLPKGVQVWVHARDADGWWHVEYDGRQGIFPGTYLSALSNIQAEPEPEPEQHAAHSETQPAPQQANRGRGGRGGPMPGRGGAGPGPARGGIAQQGGRGRAIPVSNSSPNLAANAPQNGPHGGSSPLRNATPVNRGGMPPRGGGAPGRGLVRAATAIDLSAQSNRGRGAGLQQTNANSKLVHSVSLNRSAVLSESVSVDEEEPSHSNNISSGSNSSGSGSSITNDNVENIQQTAPANWGHVKVQPSVAKANRQSYLLRSASLDNLEKSLENNVEPKGILDSATASDSEMVMERSLSEDSCLTETAAESAEETIETTKEEKVAKHRRQVVAEIITTETEYVNDLQLVVEIFLDPMRKRGIIPMSDILKLFSNIEIIYNVNNTVITKMKEREMGEGDQILGDIFLEMADFFKMYTTYCANQPVAITTLEACKKHPAYEAFLQECLLNERCRGLTLFSFLIKPIQRICKYPLLLSDLLKHTPLEHPDYENLKKALPKIAEVVDYINERKRLAENLQKILEVQNQIDVGDDLQLAGEPSRRFVREDVVNILVKGKPVEHNGYVFNDVVVLAKSQRGIMGKSKDKFKAKFFLNNIRIVDIADTDHIKDACEISHKLSDSDKQFSHIFVFKSPDEKREWVNVIKGLVKEYQKKEAQSKKQAMAREAKQREEKEKEEKEDATMVKGSVFTKMDKEASAGALGIRTNSGGVATSPLRGGGPPEGRPAPNPLHSRPPPPGRPSSAVGVTAKRPPPPDGRRPMSAVGGPGVKKDAKKLEKELKKHKGFKQKQRPQSEVTPVVGRGGPQPGPIPIAGSSVANANSPLGSGTPPKPGATPFKKKLEQLKKNKEV